jgi:hypothetical protein
MSDAVNIKDASNSRDASKSSLVSNSRDINNSRKLNKRGDLSNDRKPATAWHWSSATAVMAVRAGKLATRGMPATTGTKATAEKP